MSKLEGQYNNFLMQKNQERDVTKEMEENKNKNEVMDEEQILKVIAEDEEKAEDEIVDLKCENLPTFNEFPRGMLILKLRSLDLHI